jgi:beta-glucosidase-like glycosyl hydrolase
MNATPFKIYTAIEKKNIVHKIEQIKNKKHFIEIFKIIKNDNIKYTQNRNGLFIDMNKLSNSTIHKIEQYLKNLELTLSESDNKLSVDSLTFSNNEDDIRNIIGTYKLSNHEKSILKKFKQESNNI